MNTAAKTAGVLARRFGLVLFQSLITHLPMSISGARTGVGGLAPTAATLWFVYGYEQ